MYSSIFVFRSNVETLCVTSLFFDRKSANYGRSLLIFAFESGQKRNKSCFCGLLDKPQKKNV
jgi:hypothetical protein